MNMDISRHTLSESDMGIEKVDKEMDTYKATEFGGAKQLCVNFRLCLKW